MLGTLAIGYVELYWNLFRGVWLGAMGIQVVSMRFKGSERGSRYQGGYSRDLEQEPHGLPLP